MEKVRPRLLQNTRRVNYEFARLAVGGRERVKMNAGGSSPFRALRAGTPATSATGAIFATEGKL